MMEEITYCYVGRKSCGCMTAAAVDKPDYKEDVAKTVSDWILEGLTVDRVDVEIVRKELMSCPHQVKFLSFAQWMKANPELVKESLEECECCDGTGICNDSTCDDFGSLHICESCEHEDSTGRLKLIYERQKKEDAAKWAEYAAAKAA
jgi:hypothetical protein